MSLDRPVPADSAERVRSREAALAKTTLQRFVRARLFRSFANSLALAGALAMSLGPVSIAQAQTLIYFDSNGTVSGTGNTTATGAWSGTGNTTWNTENGGTLSAGSAWNTLATTANSVAVFSAFHPVNIANATLTITASGTIANVGGIRFSESAVTINSGTLNISQAATFTAGSLSGSTINSILSSSGGNFTLTKDGPYTLTLGGANTYTGLTNVTAGTLKISNAAALGNSTATNSGTTVSSGATLDLNGTNMTGNAEALTISGTGVNGAGALINSNTGSAATFVGNITLGSVAASFGGEGNTTISGRIVDGTTSTINKVGNGTVTLSGVNTYTGLTTITTGTLKLGNAAGLGGTTGGTTVLNGGSLDLAGQTVGAEAITINGTGVSGSGALQNSTGSASLSGAITLGSNSSIVANGTLLTLSGGIAAGTSELTLGGTGAGNVTNVISGTAATGLTKEGTGTWTLSGANTYTGITNITAGTLKVNNTSALGNSTAENSGTFVSSGASLDLNGINLGSAETLTIAGTGNGSVGALTNSNATQATYTGAVNLNSGATVGGTGNIIISGYVSNAGAGAFTKGNANTVTLSGTNAYDGITTVNGGTLKVGSYSALGASSGGNTSYGTTVTNGASLDLNGTSLAGVEALTLSGAGNGSVGALTNSGAAATFLGPITLGANAVSIGGSGNITLVNSISNGTTSTLTKVGTNTLTLLGNNGYTGLTTVSTGTLSIGVNSGSDTPLGTTAGATTVSSGASLELRPGTVANSFITVGSEALTINNTGNGATGALRNLAGNNTYGGAVTISGNASRIQSDAGTLTLNAASAVTATNLGLTLAGAGNGLISGNISLGTGSITKADAGTWTLSGNNSYSGGTVLSGGTLVLGNTNAIGTTGTITFSGGTLGFSAANSTDYSSRYSNAASQQYRFDTGGQTVNVATALTSSGGTLTKLGSGSLVMSGTNTFTGATTVSGGTLSLTGSGGKLASGTYTVSGGTLSLGLTTSGVTNRLSNTTATMTLGGTGGGGTLALVRGNATANSQTLASLAVASGANYITGGGNTSGTTPVLTLGGASPYSRSTGGTVDIGPNISVSFTNAPSASIAGSTASADAILIGATMNSGSDLVKVGTGAANAANYTATGTNTWTAGKNMRVTGDVSAAGAAVNSVTFQGTAARTVTLTGTSNIASGMVLVSSAVGANNSTFSGGNISGPSNSDLILINNNTSGNLVINSTIVNNGTTSLTLAGNGTVVLGNANTYSGGTVIQAGTLKLNNATALGSTSGNITINAGTLDLNNNNQTVGNVTGLGGNIINSTAGTATLTINGTGTYGGNISSGTGNVAITKSGTGTLALSGSNTYTGNTNITGGILEARSNTALGAGNVIVGSGGQLSLNGQGLALNLGTNTLSLNGTGTTGALVNSYATAGGTTTQVYGNISLAGNSTVNSGTTSGNILQLGIPGSYDRFTSPGNVVENSTIALGGNTLTFTGSAGTYTQIEGRITGAGNVVVNTSGVVNYYNPRNDYTGLTTVQNGTLLVDTADNPFAPRDTTYNHYTGISGSGLIIGDNVGGVGTAVVSLGNGIAQSTVNEALLYTMPVTINSDGLLKLNGNAQTIGTLTMSGGRIDATGSGLYLDYGNTTVTISPTATSGPSIIDGTLSLTHHLWAPSESGVTRDRTFDVGYDASNAATGDLIINAVITQGGIIKIGDGTMTLATSANDYAGATVINNGILNVRVGTNGSDKSSLGLSGAGGQDTTVNSGGTLQIQGDIAITKEGLTLNGSGEGGTRGALENVSGNNTWGAVISSVVYGNVTLGSSSRIGSTTGLLTIASEVKSAGGNYTLTIAGDGDVTLANRVVALDAGGVGITKTGNGTLTLSGSNGYTGLTDIQQGVVVAAHTSALGGTTQGTQVASGAELRLTGGISIANETLSLIGSGVTGDGALRNMSGTNTFAGQVTLAGDARIGAESGTTLIVGTGINASSSAYTLSVGGSGNVTSSGTVSLGSNPVVKDGTGTLTFSGTATGLGATTVNAGNVTFSNAGSLGTLTLNNASTFSVTSSASVSTAEINSGALSTLNIAAGSTLTANLTTGSSSTFSGQITGSGTIKFLGNAQVTFNQSIYDTGLTVYLGGTGAGPLTFSITNNAHLTFGDLYITGDTILDFGNSSASFLSSTNLYITPGVSITVTNWASMVDAWYVTGNSPGFSNNLGGSVTLDQYSANPQNQITFSGYSSASTAWITTATYPTFREHEIRPVPEPSTYGAIFVSGCLGLFGLRRYLRRRAEQK